MFALITALCFSWFAKNLMPQNTREILFPWTSQNVQEAFCSFQEGLSEGETFIEALEGFCRQIVKNERVEY